MASATWLVSRWNALPVRARAVGCAAAGLLLVALVVASSAARGARSELFATPLHPEQLAEVEERLASWNVAFSPEAQNVTVDANRRNDVLLRLSLAGVPHAHLTGTAEALAGVGALTPQSVVDVQAREGLAGDIEAGLRGIQGVDDARVIIAPARTAEFADESSREASAGVRLRLRDGASLDTGAIAGIRAYVAAAVPGLDPAHVTILDDRGVSLGDGDAAGNAAALQTSLQSALDVAFGDGAAIVRVHAEAADRVVERRRVRRAPLGTQAIARTAHAESYAAGDKHYTRDDESDDRGSETEVTDERNLAQAPKRLSAAVFVDESRALDLAKVRQLAAAAIGFDPQRGDTLSVAAVAFHRASPARKDVWWLLYGAVVPLLPALALGAAMLAAVRVAAPPAVDLVRGALERAGARRTARAVDAFAPARVRSVLDGEPPHAAAAIISALPAATAAAVLQLYPPHERDAIVARMQRRYAPAAGDPSEIFGRHA